MTRSIQDVENSRRHNQTKSLILFLLVKSRRYLTTPQIARRCHLTNNNASMQMKKLTGQGYVWRRTINGKYFYKFLKPMGERTCRELWIRTRMKDQVTDPRIVLNLKKKIPIEYQKLHKEISEGYYHWLEE